MDNEKPKKRAHDYNETDPEVVGLQEIILDYLVNLDCPYPETILRLATEDRPFKKFLINKIKNL